MRRVLEVRRLTVVVTSDEEWLAAKTEGREPRCIGFPASDVTEIQTSKLKHRRAAQRPALRDEDPRI